ncbi:hypothetical protein BHE74_00047546 [Ensete ventricosum]|nr:hypothetical protein BHE74_00047546 [Ensete ventricosum]
MPKLGKNQRLSSWEGEVRVRERERVREPPITCYRNGRFIPVGGELVRTPGLTLVVPQGTAELYDVRADAAVWGEGVARHATLMAHGGAGQCRTRTPPPRMLGPLPT